MKKSIKKTHIISAAFHDVACQVSFYAGAVQMLEMERDRLNEKIEETKKELEGAKQKLKAIPPAPGFRK